MNPLGIFLTILGLFIMIVGFKGSQHNIVAALTGNPPKQAL